MGYLLGKALQYAVALVLWLVLLIVVLGLVWVVATLVRAIV